jgi:hypothetical protein
VIERCPRLDQGAIDREVLIGQQPLPPRLPHDGVKEPPGRLVRHHMLSVRTEGAVLKISSHGLLLLSNSYDHR